LNRGLISDLNPWVDPEAAQSGRGRLPLVCGEAGIGKTAMLRQFHSTLPPRFTVLWGRAISQLCEHHRLQLSGDGRAAAAILRERGCGYAAVRLGLIER
jgi:hypothetical protein